jgi:hypothetical protein
VNAELFGTKDTYASVDLNCNLEYFISNLPAGHSYTVNTLIDNHTLLPFYTPFLPSERVAFARKSMAGTNGSVLRASLGLNLSSVKPRGWLRFCPLCTIDDREKFGEFYWHRLHQVSGVEVCPSHNIFLENSRAPIRNRFNPTVYIPADQAIYSVTPRPLNPNDDSHQHLLALAKDVAWLLDQKNLAPGFQVIYSVFKTLLTDMGLSTFRRRRNQDILSTFTSKFSDALLKQLQCELDSSKRHSWLNRIIVDLYQYRAHHPLRYLLLILFTGHTAESFFRMCADISPSDVSIGGSFGVGPWHCLNPACKYFRIPVIETYQIETAKKPSGALGLFSCTCGFTYTRRATDSSSNRVNSTHHVRNYGLVWESHLRRYWDDTKLTLREIGRKLGVNHSTVRHHATRLGLRGSARRVLVIDSDLEKRLQHAKAAEIRNRKDCRKQLLLALKKHPNVNRTNLRLKILPSGVYDWLFHHDREWVESKLPPPRRLGRPKVQMNNDIRDLELATEVRRSADRLKTDPGRPVRITKNTIGKDINRVRLFYDSRLLTRFPLTVTALKESVETRIDFAIRRIRWAAACFQQENITPSWTQLPYRAALGMDIWYVPQVKAVIDEAWLALQQRLNDVSIKVA